ncbi:MAG: hypothetical protein QOI65_1748 [Thermoleophilaceae bacterium]|nr:hypothetical protein [Thermoleophilaceae bacterium]
MNADATASTRAPRAVTPIVTLSQRLGCTEGQAYTIIIGLVVAVTLAVGGIPAALRSKPLAAASPNLRAAAPAAPAAPPATIGPTAPTTVPPVATPPARPSLDGSSPVSPPAAPNPPTRPPVGTITTFAVVSAPGAPGGVAVAADGTVYATTDNGTALGMPGASHVFGYSADGTPGIDVTIDGQPDGHADGLTGAAVDPRTGNIAVLDSAGRRVLVVEPLSHTVRVLVTLPDLPACLVALGAPQCEPGVQDHQPSLVAALYDGDGDLYISDPGEATIWQIAPGASNAVTWYQSTDFATGDGPTGLAWTPGGDLAFAVGTSLDIANPNAGGLYRLAINPDGSAGTRTLTHPFAIGDEPGPLVVGSSGTAYVVIRKTGSIVSIAPDGAQSGRIDPPGNGPIPIDTPSALALREGQLLVANQAPATPGHWAILAIVVNDGPVPPRSTAR